MHPIHLYVDVSGSIENTAFQQPIYDAAFYALEHGHGLYLTFFTHEVLPQFDNIEVISEKSAAAFARGLVNVRKVSPGIVSSQVHHAALGHTVRVMEMPRPNAGGTDLNKVWDLVSTQKIRNGRRNIVISDMEFMANEQQYQEYGFNKDFENVAYVSTTESDQGRFVLQQSTSIAQRTFKDMFDALSV